MNQIPATTSWLLQICCAGVVGAFNDLLDLNRAIRLFSWSTWRFFGRRIMWSLWSTLRNEDCWGLLNDLMSKTKTCSFGTTVNVLVKSSVIDVSADRTVLCVVKVLPSWGLSITLVGMRPVLRTDLSSRLNSTSVQWSAVGGCWSPLKLLVLLA